jgi:large subunit ribosomal protein L4
MEEIKTREFLSVIRTLGKENVLLITDQKDEKLELSSRNIPGVKVLRADGLNVYDILKYKYLILLEPTVRTIEGRLGA